MANGYPGTGIDILGSALGGAATGGAVGASFGGIGAVPGAIGGAVVGLGMGIGSSVAQKRQREAIEEELEELKREYEKNLADAESTAQAMMQQSITAYNTSTAQARSDAKAKAMIDAEMSGLSPAEQHAAATDAEQSVAEAYGMSAPEVYRQAQQQALSYLSESKSAAQVDYQLALGQVQTDYPDYFAELGQALGAGAETAISIGASRELASESRRGMGMGMGRGTAAEGATEATEAQQTARTAADEPTGEELAEALGMRWQAGTEPTVSGQDVGTEFLEETEEKDYQFQQGAGNEFTGLLEEFADGGVAGENGPETILVGEGGEEEVIIPMSKLSQALGPENAELLATSLEGNDQERINALRKSLDAAAFRESAESHYRTEAAGNMSTVAKDIYSKSGQGAINYDDLPQHYKEALSEEEVERLIKIGSLTRGNK